MTDDAARRAQIHARLLKSAALLEAMAQRPSPEYDQSAYQVMRDSPALAGIAPDLREAAVELSRLSETQQQLQKTLRALAKDWQSVESPPFHPFIASTSQKCADELLASLTAAPHEASYCPVCGEATTERCTRHEQIVTAAPEAK